MGFFNEKANAINNRRNMNQMTMSPVDQAEQKYQNAKKEVDDAYLILGKAYFEANRDNANSEFSEHISAIIDKIEKETLWNQYRLSLDGKTLCEHCGVIITSDSLFCNKCGGKIAPRDFSSIGIVSNQVNTEAQQNVCPNCGSVLTEGAAFCEKCGSRI